jgi:uncharacterized protein (DUF1810 family)
MPDLQRFIEAQNQPGNGFEAALAELAAGRKRGHWIWWIFPQLRGLGVSPTSQRYGLDGIEEARAYLAEPLLRQRLLAAARAAADHLARGQSLGDLMGSDVDAVKLVSSMTLFDAVAREDRPSPGSGDEYAGITRTAGAILDASEAQGYSRCERTLAALARGDAGE